jgi:preprotein translocase subunit SecA
VKNVAKWEDVIKDNTDQIYAFVDEFLEEEMKSSSIYETDEDVDYEFCHQTIMLMQHLA